MYRHYAAIPYKLNEMCITEPFFVCTPFIAAHIFRGHATYESRSFVGAIRSSPNYSSYGCLVQKQVMDVFYTGVFPEKLEQILINTFTDNESTDGVAVTNCMTCPNATAKKLGNPSTKKPIALTARDLAAIIVAYMHSPLATRHKRHELLDMNARTIMHQLISNDNQIKLQMYVQKVFNIHRRSIPTSYDKMLSCWKTAWKQRRPSRRRLQYNGAVQWVVVDGVRLQEHES